MKDVLTEDQVCLIASLFQIQYGDKTIFELFGSGNKTIKIKDFVLLKDDYFVNFNFNDEYYCWFILNGNMILTHDTFFLWNESPNAPSLNGESKKTVKQIIEMLNFKDKV